MKTRMIEPVLLDVRSAAVLLNIPQRSLYHHIREGHIPHVRIGHRVFVHQAELEAWLRRQVTGGGVDRPTAS